MFPTPIIDEKFHGAFCRSFPRLWSLKRDEKKKPEKKETFFTLFSIPFILLYDCQSLLLLPS